MNARLDVLAVSLAILAILGIASCKTIGQQFSHDHVTGLVPGQTTQKEVLEKFGNPNRVGVESGQLTWSYIDYYVSLFGSARTRDLKITFDNRRVVTAYEYSTSVEAEQKSLSASVR